MNDHLSYFEIYIPHTPSSTKFKSPLPPTPAATRHGACSKPHIFQTASLPQLGGQRGAQAQPIAGDLHLHLRCLEVVALLGYLFTQRLQPHHILWAHHQLAESVSDCLRGAVSSKFAEEAEGQQEVDRSD